MKVQKTNKKSNEMFFSKPFFNSFVVFMKMKRFSFHLIQFHLIFLSFAFNSRATTYTVNSLANTNTGTGTSGTLRYCINQANGSIGPHLINFSVAGTIPISSNAVVLPTLTRAITIDATTAPGYISTPVVFINGTGSTAINGLTISAADCVLYGLEIHNFPYSGIVVSSDACDNFIIGASAKGNVVRNNGYYGVNITGADNGFFQYNKVGTNAAGSSCAANGYYGVQLVSGANNNSILNNHISCNDYDGLLINASNSNVVKGNIFGPLSALCTDNGYRGINIENGASNNVIGGTASGEANKIAGNQYWGIEVEGSTTLNNIISGNSISCNSYGGIELSAGGNASYAAPVISTASGTTISGTSPANAIIQVFRDQSVASCAFTPANNQGADYLGTTIATGGGTWSITGTFSGFVVATARSSTGNTSEFSTRVNTGVSGTVTNPCLGIIVLPIELLRFDASPKENVVELSWSTANEINNNYFTVEKSFNGEEWLDVGTVKGAGNSSTPRHYTLTDIRPSSGVQYYRLKQTDYDGRFKYSDVISVKYSTAFDNKLTVYPNPAQELLFLAYEFSDSEEMPYEIYDAVGAQVMNGMVHAKHSFVKIDHLVNGVYLVVVNNDLRSACRFIKTSM